MRFAGEPQSGVMLKSPPRHANFTSRKNLSRNYQSRREAK
jgi:hypothetical protein